MTNPNLSERQFDKHLITKVDPTGYVSVQHPKHGFVGELTFDPDSREVMNIEVPPKFQRRGVGTRMWNAAQAHGIALEHSATRTDEGDAWAHSVGGKLPPRKRDDDWR